MYAARTAVKTILVNIINKEEFFIPLRAISAGRSPFVARDHELLFREGLR